MKKFLKWLGIILAGMIGLVILLMGITYLLSNTRINKTYTVEPAPVAVPTDSAAIAEGQRLFVTRGCPDCHGPDGAGIVLLDNPLLGRFAGTNLTAGQGGIGAEMSDADWVRAIRHGLDPAGKPILVMPANEYNPMNDSDLGALIAYTKTLPAVNRASVANTLGPVGRALLVTNQAPFLSAESIDHAAARPAAVAMGATVEYGKYLSVTCTGCHGSGLSGGPVPGDPSGPPHPSNLTPDPDSGLGAWSEADFIAAMRQGVGPDGSPIDEEMPWRGFRQMTDIELQALWQYLQSLEVQPYGNR